MKIYRWKIIEEFDTKKDYGQRIPPRVCGILSLLQKDQILLSREFFESNKDKIKEFLRTKTDRAAHKAVEVSFPVGVKIGIIKKLKGPNNDKISYEEFCKIPEVSYWLSQLNGSNVKNITAHGGKGTKGLYSYKLWNFHTWLIGKTFEFQRMIQTGEETFQRKKQKITLEGVDHLLRLYQEMSSNPVEYIKIVKTYLLDSKHEGNRAKTVDLDSCAIKSFFKESDSELIYSFNAKSKYLTTDAETEKRSLALDELLQILTVGNPTLTEKAVFLCKFHRGLDSITLADRFNYQAFDQIARHFKSSDHNIWDLERCPVPITLVRVKTDFKHTGFLDRDAIVALQLYLDYRQKKTGKMMNADEPLFLSKQNHPINTSWIEKQFNKLAVNAGLQKRLKGYRHMNKYASHELRDLLKSTLIASGTRYDVADHCIGHMPKDSYEKQATLYPENLRAEFMKASRKLNIFSNITHYMKGDEQTEVLRNQIETLRRKLEQRKSEENDELSEFKKKIDELWQDKQRMEQAQKAAQ